MRLVPKFMLASCAALAFGAAATQAYAEVHQTGFVNVPADRYADVSWTKFEGPVNRLRFYATNDTIDCDHISVTYRDGITREVFRGSIPLGGYTTVTFESGRWWVSRLDRPMKHRGHTGWDWSGAWVLRADGRVVSAPRPDVDPPGLYPSPRRAGELELWTGHQWTAHFPEPPAGGQA